MIDPSIVGEKLRFPGTESARELAGDHSDLSIISIQDEHISPNGTLSSPSHIKPCNLYVSPSEPQSQSHPYRLTQGTFNQPAVNGYTAVRSKGMGGKHRTVPALQATISLCQRQCQDKLISSGLQVIHIPPYLNSP